MIKGIKILHGIEIDGRNVVIIRNIYCSLRDYIDNLQ